MKAFSARFFLPFLSASEVSETSLRHIWRVSRYFSCWTCFCVYCKLSTDIEILLRTFALIVKRCTPTPVHEYVRNLSAGEVSKLYRAMYIVGYKKLASKYYFATFSQQRSGPSLFVAVPCSSHAAKISFLFQPPCVVLEVRHRTPSQMLLLQRFYARKCHQTGLPTDPRVLNWIWKISVY